MNDIVLDHVKVTVEFGHSIPDEVYERMQKAVHAALSNAFGVEIPTENLPDIPRPFCPHVQLDGKVNAGVHAIDDTAIHRRLVHEVVDRLFDEFAEKQSDPEFAAHLQENLNHDDSDEDEDAIDTDSLLDMLRNVNVEGE